MILECISKDTLINGDIPLNKREREREKEWERERERERERDKEGAEMWTVDFLF